MKEWKETKDSHEEILWKRRVRFLHNTWKLTLCVIPPVILLKPSCGWFGVGCLFTQAISNFYWKDCPLTLLEKRKRNTTSSLRALLKDPLIMQPTGTLLVCTLFAKQIPVSKLPVCFAMSGMLSLLGSRWIK